MTQKRFSERKRGDLVMVYDLDSRFPETWIGRLDLGSRTWEGSREAADWLASRGYPGALIYGPPARQDGPRYCACGCGLAIEAEAPRRQVYAKTSCRLREWRARRAAMPEAIREKIADAHQAHRDLMTEVERAASDEYEASGKAAMQRQIDALKAEVRRLRRKTP